MPSIFTSTRNNRMSMIVNACFYISSPLLLKRVSFLLFVGASFHPLLIVSNRFFCFVSLCLFRNMLGFETIVDSPEATGSHPADFGEPAKGIFSLVVGFLTPNRNQKARLWRRKSPMELLGKSWKSSSLVQVSKCVAFALGGKPFGTLEDLEELPPKKQPDE